LKKELDRFECQSVNIRLVSGGVDGFDRMVETPNSGTGPEPRWSIYRDFRVEEDKAWNKPWIANPGLSFRDVICHSR